MNFWQNLGKFVITAATVAAGWLGYHPLGTTIYKPVPRFETSLSLPLPAAQTSTMTLASGVDGNGQVLSGSMCFTLDSGVAGKIEDLCGTASGTIVSNLVRGVASDGYTSSSSLARDHRVGADVKTTDSPYLPQYYALLNGSAKFPNVLQYDPTTVSQSSFSANTSSIPNVQFVISVASSGAANAAVGVKGLVGIISPSGAATSSDGAGTIYNVISKQYYATSSPATTSVVMTNPSGTIDLSFIDQTKTYAWSGSSSYSNVASISVNTATTTATTTDQFNLMPAGIVQMYAASTTAPGGWLVCDGTVYNSSTYPRLYAVLKQTYGGSSTLGTFGVPDLRGRFVAGPSSSIATTLGSTGGATSTTVGPFSLVGGTNVGGANPQYSNGSTNSSTISLLNPYLILQFIIKY